MSEIRLSVPVEDRLAALETTVLRAPAQAAVEVRGSAKAEGCSTRQVMRKVEQKTLPPPDDVINGRLFWWFWKSVERYRSKRSQADTAAGTSSAQPGPAPPARPPPPKHEKRP